MLFFISDDGLALFPLYPMCLEKELVFSVADSTKRKGFADLPNPVVLDVFLDAGTALLKFDHRPKKHLRLSEETVSLGSWVAIVTSSEASDPVMGPVVAAARSRFQPWSGGFSASPESVRHAHQAKPGASAQ